MKKILIISVLLIGLMSFKSATTSELETKLGSGPAYLTCKSDSGRTEFNAVLQDITGILFKAELAIDSTKVKYKTDKGHTIFDPKNGVLTLYIDDGVKKSFPGHSFLEFWSIPSTFKTIKNKSGHQIYEFKANIYGSEIREDKERHTPIITLNCRLEYQI